MYLGFYEYLISQVRYIDYHPPLVLFYQKMSSTLSKQRKHYQMTKRYSKRRKFLLSMSINWPGMIRPRVGGLFLFLKGGLMSKRKGIPNE